MTVDRHSKNVCFACFAHFRVVVYAYVYAITCKNYLMSAINNRQKIYTRATQTFRTMEKCGRHVIAAVVVINVYYILNIYTDTNTLTRLWSQMQSQF